MESFIVKMKPLADLFVQFLGGSNIYPSLLLAFAVLLVSYFHLSIRKLPPGPYGVPFIGYLPILRTKKRAELILNLSREFDSDVVSLRIYGQIIVFLNSHQLVKECFVKRADLADRIDGAMFNILDPDYAGLIGSSGSSWKEHRRFSLYVMRDFGMGKVRAEEIVQHETEMVIKEFHATEGRTFDPIRLVNSAVSNVICSMIFGQRYEYDDQEFVRSLKSMNELLVKFGGSRVWMLLRNKYGRIVFYKMLAGIRSCFEGFAQFARKSVKEHIDSYDDNSMNDLIDAYLRECYAEKKSPTSSIVEKNLHYLIIDMFLAGSETTFTTLRWSLLYMASYPEVQERVHRELRENIGNRLPSMSDKKATPYTEATLSEIQRINTLLPLGLFHTNRKSDFEIKGFRIPKGTPVAANLHAIHRDPTIWSNPEEFDPQNFLRDGKVVNSEYLVPFSIGRRSCAGEALARMELYIFFASWLLNFEVRVADAENKPTLDGVHRGVFQPEPFEIRLLPRELK